jgi:predicted MFS family arabinose efflux permease
MSTVAMVESSNLGRRIIDAVSMFIVTAMSLLLLLYVGYGEARRTYEQIELEKLTAQGYLIQNTIEKFLRDDLPLKQFPGFATIARPLVDGLADVDAMMVYDHDGRQLFLVKDKTDPKLPPVSEAIRRLKRDIEIDTGETHYQVVVPLRTRFETAGALVIMSRTDAVSGRLQQAFLPLLFLVALLAVVFAVGITLAAPNLARTKVPWLQIVFSCTFLLMAAALVYTLVLLYFGGVKGKADTAASTFSQRFSDIVTFSLAVSDFDGIDKAVNEFRQLNTEVSEVAVIVNGSIRHSSNKASLNRPWVSDSGAYEFKVDLAAPAQARQLSVAVRVPRTVVYERVQRSIKNFAALFIASIFLSGVFLQVAVSLQGARSAKSSSAAPTNDGAAGGIALILLKPLYFLGVFLDSLTYAFLPKFMQEAATTAGMPASFASVPFTAYYLLFALSLIPAGNLTERYGPNRVIVAGLLLAGASVLGLALPLGIFEMTGFRALAGIGQGLLLIGVQSYILNVASPDKKTQGTAIIVLGFQGGMLSGMAIGSLLVNSLQPDGVFMVAGGVGLVAALYTLTMLPRIAGTGQAVGGLAATMRRLVADCRNVITDAPFLKAIFCIGIPAKALLTGVISFAIPLILTQQGYRAEDIGQLIMLYGLGVVASTGVVSRLVDRTRNTQSILFWGAIVSGIGLMLVGLMGSKYVGNGHLSTVVAIVGIVLVGIAHGFINAPVVTHVGLSDLADRIGAVPATTTYRFLERAGHISGPFLVSQLFLIWGQGPYIIGWIGVGITVLGLVFAVQMLRPRVSRMETAQ